MMHLLCSSSKELNSAELLGQGFSLPWAHHCKELPTEVLTVIPLCIYSLLWCVCVTCPVFKLFEVSECSGLASHIWSTWAQCSIGHTVFSPSGRRETLCLADTIHYSHTSIFKPLMSLTTRTHVIYFLDYSK